MRPSPGRARAGHDGSAVRDHEAAGERCHPAVQLVNRVGDDYTAHGHDHDGAMQVIGDEPMQFQERRPSATGGKGFEGAQHPLASRNVRTLRGLAHGSYRAMSQLRPQVLPRPTTRRLPVLPVEWISDHPGYATGRPEPTRGRLSRLVARLRIDHLDPGRELTRQGSSRQPKAVSFPAAWSGRRRHQVKESGLPGERDVFASVDDRGPSEECPSDHRRHGVRAPGRACDAGEFVSNTGALPRSHRSSCRAISTTACLRSAHSQTIATRQPAWSRSRRLRRSRSVFASNLARQNSLRVVGIVVYGQPACRCQKQPCTKHTAPNRRNTRSGVPGSLRSCKRYRSPRAWTARRSASSGRVSLLPIPAIMRERVARSTMSAIIVPARTPAEHRRQQATREFLDVMQLDGMRRSGVEPVWSVRLRRGHSPTEGRAPGNTGSCGAVSPFECDP